MHHADSPPKQTLSAIVRGLTGLNPARCYQCGKCSGGCPMASEMNLRTHEIIRLVQLDRAERLFEDEAIWLCLTCETCSERCPNEVDPARLIDGLREAALSKGLGKPPRRIEAFHRSFIEQIRAHGRIFEFGLVAWYKLRSGDFFSDVAQAPAMMARGKLALSPQSIKGQRDVQRIVDACLAEGEKR